MPRPESGLDCLACAALATAPVCSFSSAGSSSLSPTLRSGPGSRSLHSAPYTLHSAHYSLHPTPYTLHPTDAQKWTWKQVARERGRAGEKGREGERERVRERERKRERERGGERERAQKWAWKQVANRQPLEGGHIVISFALICATSRRIPASPITNQGPDKGGFMAWR